MDPRQQYAIDAGFGGAYAAGEQFKARTADEQYADKNLAAFKEAFGKIAPPQLTPGVKQQTGAEGQLWQGIGQQQQLAQAQASRRGFSATGARAAGQAGAEMESAGYGQAAQIRAAEEARRREMAMQLAQQQTGAMSQQDALATQRIQDRAAQYGFEQAAARQLEEADAGFWSNLGSGLLNLFGTAGAGAAVALSDENLKKDITDGSAEADARLDALSGTLPLPEDADIRGGSYYKQTGPIMTVYTPRPGAVFEANAKQKTTRNEAMPKNDYAEANEFYDTLIDEQERRRAAPAYTSRNGEIVFAPDAIVGSAPVAERSFARAPRVATVATPLAMRSAAPAMERAIPVEMTRARPMQVVTAGPSLEPDYEALAEAVRRGRENPQVEAGLRAARDTFNVEAALMQRAREQQRNRLLGREVVIAPETITARVPAEATRSMVRNPRVADEALNALTPYQYAYRQRAIDAGEPDGRQLGIMAQNVERSPLRDAVVETPIGKGIRTADELMYDMLPLFGRVNERLRKVEGKKAPAKSEPTRQEPRMMEFRRGALKEGEG
jgi:hypothetical protein